VRRFFYENRPYKKSLVPARKRGILSLFLARSIAKKEEPTMNAAILALTLTLAADTDAPKVELLWPKGAPGAVGEDKADKPTLTVYLPPADKATGAAVVVCPGGGYGALAVGHEGKDPAEFLNKLGIAAFVLQYRIAPRYHHPAPLQDAQRALRTVRSRAKEWNLDPHKIGIWGFSAGGR
jgi:acetyl esterase/lipase